MPGAPHLPVCSCHKWHGDKSLSDTKSFDKDYLYPYAPINFKEQLDGFIKVNDKKIKYRNPLLSNNKIRGRINKDGELWKKYW